MTTPVNSSYPANPVAEAQVNATPKQAKPAAAADNQTQDTVQISNAARAAPGSSGDFDHDGDSQ